MEERKKTVLMSILGDNVRFQSRIAQYTAFRTGGNADAICFPDSMDQLKKTLLSLDSGNIPYLVIGKGSNLLINDKGFNGAFIILKGEFETIDQDTEDWPMVRAWSGVSNNSLLSYCSKNGLAGLEFLAGIPGTIGGAVAMNAGAYGHTIGDLVYDVLTMTKQGQEIKRQARDIRFEYRKTDIPDEEIILRAGFRLKRESKEIIRERISDNLQKRRESQPLNLPSAGSVFKNPPNDFAGRLLEKAGLKGTRIGGAMISSKHANFIVNTGGASSKDFFALMNHARDRVREMTGIELEPEVKLINN